MGFPASCVVRKLLKHHQSAFGPPVPESVGYLGACAGWNDASAIDRSYAYQVADIRYHPRCTGLDKEIVVELRKIFLHHLSLLRQHRYQGLQRAAQVRVADPVDGRQ